MKQEKLLEFQKKTGYEFKNTDLLITALTHSSYSNENRLKKYMCNERLEFLGDAVLELISSEQIYKENPTKPEGDMTRIRASWVCEPTLALCARDIDLGDYVMLGRGEDLTGGRERDSILSDTLEATIGAVYLDGGFEKAREYINRHILNDIEKKKLFYDSKTILQEIVQGEHLDMEYELLKEEGPDHNKSFKESVFIGKKEYGIGCGRTKKAAEQDAAYKTILMLREMDKE